MPNPIPIASETAGPETGPVLLWAHGWGQSRKAFLPLAASFETRTRNVLIDFPGFGDSPAPPAAWGTDDYADAMAAYIKANLKTPVLWIGHSFGCRVGLQIAARHPELVSGLFLIAAAGLKRKRPLHKKLYMKARIRLFKTLKALIPSGLINQDWLYKTFGSSDYRNAGSMRGVFVKTVNEDLSEVAAQVKCPVMLVYGSDDSETPPEIGRRLRALIPQSELAELPGLDHYTVLTSGRHQVAPLLNKFMERINA